MKLMLLGLLALLITACQSGNEAEPVATAPVDGASQRLDRVLAAQSVESQARYVFRHPKQTLEFFAIQPGMTVIEALPGEGWYTKILLPYLGAEGKLIGVDYHRDIWQHFDWVDATFLQQRHNWTSTWKQQAEAWRTADSASIDALVFGQLDRLSDNSVDAILFIRALHNMQRFEDKGKFLSQALAESYRVLKPGGIVGVVQHAAPEDKSDVWADGSRGYVKPSTLIAYFEAAGFTFDGETEVNANPLDKPGEEDVVWRLPPSLSTSNNDPMLRERMLAIGESNRMTLKFIKASVQ